MIHIALCDDNIECLHITADLVRRQCAIQGGEISICPLFSSPDELLSYVKTNPIDILLLDIQMSSMNGIELAQQVRDIYRDIKIIFISAYTRYVFQSFSVVPLAFVRKSHIAQELPSVLKKAIELCSEPDKSLVFHTTDGIISLSNMDMIYIACERNYYLIHCTGNRVYKCRGTLTELEKKLPAELFCRVHAAYIVNFAHVRRLERNSFYMGSKHEEIMISQRRLAECTNRYLEYARRHIVI